MGTSAIPSGGGGGLQPKYQKFTTSGTFTLPDGYGVAKPLLIQIQAIGGGGGSFTNTKTATFNSNGGFQNYFGEGQVVAGNYNWTSNVNGKGGGSGGLCSTQLYLTGSLSITIGAAGARDTTNMNSSYSAGNQQRGDDYANWNANPTGGTGGTTTAGVLQATGGSGAVLNGFRIRSAGGTVGSAGGWTNFTMSSHGNGGIPAGTAGGASPLLGTIAGGSGDTTPVRGSFGVGGISTDGTTSTGTDGSGGGANSIGASGAVIITWWQ
jgi:hypothetical protein